MKIPGWVWPCIRYLFGCSAQPRAISVWTVAEETVNSIRRVDQLHDDVRKALKQQLRSSSAATALAALTVVDCIALNCGLGVRRQLADKKWIKAIQALMSESTPVALGAMQLLTHWAFVFR